MAGGLLADKEKVAPATKKSVKSRASDKKHQKLERMGDIIRPYVQVPAAINTGTEQNENSNN